MPKPASVAPKQRKSPLIKQWEEAKKSHPDKLIIFRVGDFYELFGEDAEKAAKVLGLTLTKRQDGDKVIAMAGFPHHSLEVNLKKLLQAKLRVAIAEPVS